MLLVPGLQPSAPMQGELWGLIPTQGICAACWASLASRAGQSKDPRGPETSIPGYSPSQTTQSWLSSTPMPSENCSASQVSGCKETLPPAGVAVSVTMGRGCRRWPKKSHQVLTLEATRDTRRGYRHVLGESLEQRMLRFQTIKGLFPETRAWSSRGMILRLSPIPSGRV